MKFRTENKYLTVNKEDVNLYIKCLLQARNTYIEQGKPVDDVIVLLERFLKLKKKMRA